MVVRTDEEIGVSLGFSTSYEEIRLFARKLADQSTRPPWLFKNPANAAQVLCDIAYRRYGVTLSWANNKEAKPVTLSHRDMGKNAGPSCTACAEPQHDGIAHWHLLLIMPPPGAIKIINFL